MNVIARRWDRFRERRLAKLILPDTLVGPERIHNLYVLAKRIEEEKIPGDVIECGVCNGGTAALLAQFATRSGSTAQFGYGFVRGYAYNNA